ncbi:uncharacterized protein L199_004666 [Kwoniella botswanensis]|uniref:uncharacterized protein n=1 Tax=Kwoniella botswanensis TaxID=1268659 RepID=UPI00315C7380
MSFTKHSSSRGLRSLKHTGDFHRVTQYTPLDMTADTQLPSDICPTLHKWQLHPANHTVYTDDDQVHVTLSPSVGGRGTTLPEISEMTINLRDLNKYKTSISNHLENSQGPIDLSDYSKVPQQVTVDVCPFVGYSRISHAPLNVGQDERYEGTFSVYSGQATIEDRHRSLISYYSAIVDSLHQAVLDKGLPTMIKEANCKFSKPPGSDIRLSLISSEVDVKLTMYDERGRGYTKDVTMKISGFNRYNTRLPSRVGRDPEVFSWTTVPFKPQGNSVSWNVSC